MIFAILFVLVLTLAFVLLPGKKDPRLPPSPNGWLPLIGHLRVLGELPHEALLELAKKYGGVMYLEIGKRKTLVASSPAAAKEVLKTQDRSFASRPSNQAAKYFGYESTDLVWSPYGDHWRNLRKICTLEIFTVRRVQMFQPLRKLEMALFIKDLIEASNNKTPVDISSRLFQFSFNTMNRIVLNKSFAEAPNSISGKKDMKYFLLLNEASKLGSGLQIGEIIPWLSWFDPKVYRMKRVQKLLDDYIGEQLQEHRKKWEVQKEIKDFMDVMISGGAIDDTRIKALASDLIAAGTDTIALTLDWTMIELMKNPEILRLAKQELEEVVGRNNPVEEEHVPKLPFLQAIVKETLRMHPPAPLLIPHESVEACDILGYNVPAGTMLLVNAYALGRDQSFWKDADKYDPKRFLGNTEVDYRGQNFELLPFGSGRRICPGMNMGLTMAHYALANLLHTFDWSFPDGYELNTKTFYGVVLLRDKPLLLVPRLVKE